MKKNIKLVNFVCNECEKESGDKPQPDSDSFKGEHPFPYCDGWIYIYNVGIKILGKKVELKDVHLCSATCFTKFFKKLIDKSKKEGKKDANNKNKHRTSTKQKL